MAGTVPAQAREDVLGGHGVVQAMVLADVLLDLGDEVVLVGGVDDRVTAGASHGDAHWFLLAVPAAGVGR